MRFIILILELRKYRKNVFLCVYNVRMDGKDQTKHYCSLTTVAVTDIQSTPGFSCPSVLQKTIFVQAELNRLSGS